MEYVVNGMAIWIRGEDKEFDLLVYTQGRVGVVSSQNRVLEYGYILGSIIHELYMFTICVCVCAFTFPSSSAY